jgi:LmbE family N-acetylglucosaminyl deacetylase
VSTIAFLHAHPDDEVISTGGSIARASAEGHRVVLVVATNGDLGEAADDLGDGESIVDRRRAETERSAAQLGVHRIVWLGYRDSGMTGWPDNEDERSFLSTPIESSAERVADVLRDERADAIVVYDWHGMYGHPDHVQVHRVGHRAAEMAETPDLFEATFNRDLVSEAFRSGQVEFDPDESADDGNPVGTPASEIHLAVDVSAYVGRKRRALACHASQTTDVGDMMRIPEEIFNVAFGTEWFIHPGAEPGLAPGWFFD